MSYGDPYAAEQAAAAGTEDLSWEVLDVNGAEWTLSNPSAFGTPAYSTDGAGNTTLSWANNNVTSDNIITFQSNFDGPRIYIPLSRPDGTPYRFDDFPDGNITLRIKCENFVRPADEAGGSNPLLGAVLGLCEAPTATSRQIVGGMCLNGLGWGYTGVTNPRTFYTYTNASQNGLQNANHRSAIASITYAGNGGGAVDVLTFSATGNNEIRNSRNSNVYPLAARTGQIYLCLGWGGYSVGSDITGQDLTAKLSYKIISFDTIT